MAREIGTAGGTTLSTPVAIQPGTAIVPFTTWDRALETALGSGKAMLVYQGGSTPYVIWLQDGQVELAELCHVRGLGAPEAATFSRIKAQIGLGTGDGQAGQEPSL